jgi:hypothetical protein
MLRRDEALMTCWKTGSRWHPAVEFTAARPADSPVFANMLLF